MNQLEKKHLEKVNLIILEDYQRVNQQFIKEAISQWDTTGSGCFALFIQHIVAKMWSQMIEGN